MTKAPTPKSHLPLSVPVHQILLSLAGRDQHGYSVIQDIRERTMGEVELTASTLYGALSRMLEDELILEVEQPVPEPNDSDHRRRYYHITAWGREVARAEASRLLRTVDLAREKGLGPQQALNVQKGKV